MIAGAKWASMHTEDSLVGPVESWHESCLPLGGPGCPGVVGTRSPIRRRAGQTPTGTLLGHSVEGFYRLPDAEAGADGPLQASRFGMIRTHDS